MPGIPKQRAFSLLELILVIVLLGVMAGGAGLLITTPIVAYNDQLRRQQLVDQAEMALRQIARDVRLALPNSIRIGGAGTALEMVNTVDGARYRDEAAPIDYTDPVNILDFTTADDQFNFLGRLGNLTPADFAAGGKRLVIYNTSATSLLSNIYSEAADSSDFQGIVTRGDMTFTMTTLDPGVGLSDDEDNLLMSAPFRFTQQSPGQRAFIINGPISYICSPGTNTITRYDSYAYRSAQLTSDAALAALGGVQSGLVVTKLSACNINYLPGTASRGGIITLEITVTDSGESITLLHQIHVDNVP